MKNEQGASVVAAVVAAWVALAAAVAAVVAVVRCSTANGEKLLARTQLQIYKQAITFCLVLVSIMSVCDTSYGAVSAATETATAISTIVTAT